MAPQKTDSKDSRLQAEECVYENRSRKSGEAVNMTELRLDLEEISEVHSINLVEDKPDVYFIVESTSLEPVMRVMKKHSMTPSNTSTKESVARLGVQLKPVERILELEPVEGEEK